MKKIILFAVFVFVIFSFVAAANAQTRKAVGAAEVNGTFRSYFSGRTKGSYEEIKILSVGKGKLKISFELTYPYLDGTGQMSANVGEATGEAEIEGDTAVYESTEFGQCKITVKFVKPGAIKVTQTGNDTDCGFGHNVNASGDYKKISGRRPKF